MNREKNTPAWVVKKQVSAILCSDLHLKDKRPVGRNDDFLSTIIRKLTWIKDLQTECSYCPVLCAGDVFDYWKASPNMLTVAEMFLPEPFITIPGQHDLPYHSKPEFYKSALYHLWSCRRITIPIPGPEHFEDTINRMKFVVIGYNYEGELFTPGDLPNNDRKVALIHQFAYRGRKPWPGCEAEGLKSIMKKLRGYDLIVIGDNHKPFTYRNKRTNQLIVNCGSLLRLSADQINHKPRVYLWNAETNSVCPAYIPIDKNAIDREHLKTIENRNERIDAFVKQLKGQFAAGVSFEQNMKNYLRNNDVRPIVKRKISQALED